MTWHFVQFRFVLRNASGMGFTSHSPWTFNVPRVFGVHHAIAPFPTAVPTAMTVPRSGAGFIAESIQGVGRSVEFPEGYLRHACEHLRAAGGECIADEVQTGLGCTGTHFWGRDAGVMADSSPWPRASGMARRSPSSSPRRRSRPAARHRVGKGSRHQGAQAVGNAGELAAYCSARAVSGTRPSASPRR